MNHHFDDVVAEVISGNFELNDESTLEDFKNWIEVIKEECADMSLRQFTEEYPNFECYSTYPEKYWPFIEKELKA